MSLGAGALKVEGPIARKGSGEHCLGGNHGNQASANHPAPSHWKSSVEQLPQPILTYPGVGGVGAITSRYHRYHRPWIAIMIFLTWLRSLSTAFVQFLTGQFSFLAEICLCLPATRKSSLQNFLNHSSWTLDSDHVRGHTTRWRQSCVYTLITHSSRSIKTRVLCCSLYKRLYKSYN